MAYSKTTWVTGDTITADGLNNIEEGIEANDLYKVDGYGLSMTMTDGIVSVSNGEDTVPLNGSGETIIDTASGSIASFPDGSDLPVKSLTLNIEPAQDLNGYEYPWVGGAGKNKFNINAVTKFIYNGNESYATASVTDGVLSIPYNNSQHGGITINNLLPITSGTVSLSFDAYLEGTNSGLVIAYGFRNSTATADATTNVTNESGTKNAWKHFEHTFTLNSNASNGINVIIIPWSSGNTVKVKNIQVEISASATSYAPYENICPITGRTGGTVYRAGKNLFNPTSLTSRSMYTVASDGTITITASDSTAWANCQSFPLKAGSYILSRSTATGAAFFRTSQNDYASDLFSMSNGTATKTFTIATDCECKLKVGNSASSYPVTTTVQIEVGSTATAYEPYQGTTIPVTWDSAGTVYGGTLDVVSGEMVVDRAVVTFDGSNDEDWVAWSGLYACRNVASNGATTGDASKFLCNSFKGIGFYSSPPSTMTVGEYFLNSYNTTWNKNVSFKYDDGNDLSGFKAVIANNPIQLVYPIATPLTYTLTPQEVKTLLGSNNIWTDVGSISVTYRADTKLYVDKKTDAIETMIAPTESLIAPTETSTTASRNYAVGSYLIMGSQLYKVTSAIASGGTITVGTNVTATTIMAEIMAL